MGFGDTFKKLIGIEDIEDDFEAEEIEAAKESLVRETRESIRRPQPNSRVNSRALFRTLNVLNAKR